MRRLLLLLPLVLGLSACEEDVVLESYSGTDVLFQNPPTQVDILLVVDNSCSMEDEQDKLSQGFDAFVEFFDVADVDYQIGITTTDMDDPEARGRLVDVPLDPEDPDDVGVRIIRRETPDADLAFRANVRVGTDGSGSERGLDAAEAALTDHIDGHNAGFLRDDALLSIIFVSDEEDGSYWPVNRMVTAFRSIKGERERDAFNASALVGLDPNTGVPEECGRVPDQEFVGAAAGERYHDVAVQTGGVAASICAEEFSDIVNRMGLASSRLKEVFELTAEPDVETVEVLAYFASDPEAEVDLPADGLLEEDGSLKVSPWVLESDEEEGLFWVRFTDVARLPPLDTRLVITYEFG